MFWISTLGTSIFSCMGLFRINFFSCRVALECWLCPPEYLLWLGGLDLKECCFFLYMPGGRSVLWCLTRLTWAAWGSLTTCLIWYVVAFDASTFLANCLTLFAGNFSKSTLLSFMLLDTNSSSFKKNHNISLCKILGLSGGYLARDTFPCIALYHSSTDWFPCLKHVSRSNLVVISCACCLQESS